MGGASSAVFWGPASASWTNPAALGYQHGTTYAWARGEWSSFEGWTMTSNRLSLGDWGFGLTLSGEPADALGGTDFEDDNDVFALPEGDVRSFAFGANLIELSENLMDKLGHSLPDVSRYADVSLGMTFTTTREVVRTTSTTIETDSETSDYGVLIRLTPYNSVDYPGLEPALDELLLPIIGGLRIDAAYGFARHDYADHAPFRFDQKGGSLRFSSGTPGLLHDWFLDTGLEWLSRSLSPLISFGMAWDDKDTILLSLSPEGTFETTHDSDLSGWELTFANIFTVRRGEFGEHPTDALDTQTDGWGLGFKLADYGYFRYDHAGVADGDSEYEGVTINIDALEILNSLGRDL